MATAGCRADATAGRVHAARDHRDAISADPAICTGNPCASGLSNHFDAASHVCIADDGPHCPEDRRLGTTSE